MKKIILFLTILCVLTLSSCFYKSTGVIIGDPTISKYGIAFNDTVYEKDGFEKQLEITGSLPAGFTVSYENNTGRDAGSYYATCHIYDETDTLVESHNATLIIENKKNFAFNLYLDQFLAWYLNGDNFACNVFFESPAEFNLDHFDAKWYTYEEEYTDELIEYYHDSFDQMLDGLYAYGQKDLSPEQIVAYNQLVSFMKYYKEMYSIKDVPYLSGRYIDQFGGYVSNFISSVEMYTLRSEQDVIDMIDLVKSTKEAFNSYITFANDKTNKGYPYSNYTLTEMSNYLSDLLEERYDYYLIDKLENKINESNIASSNKTSYIQILNEAFDTSFFEGVESLKNGIDILRDNSNKVLGYWNTYEEGTKLYELELKNLLGIENLDLEKYINQIDKELNSTSEAYQNELRKIAISNGLSTTLEVNEFINKNVIYDGTPEEMIDYLKDFAKTIVPELSVSPEIVIKEMDEASAKVSNAVAYYTKSAIDANTKEYITLNPLNISGKNDLLSTLAHEGYPGHLYAYCYLKSTDLHPLMKVMSQTVHAEGWATYVSLALYDYVESTTDSKKIKSMIPYLQVEELNNYLLESKLDLYIHLKDWDKNDIASYFDENGYNVDAAERIYNLLIEMPVTYNAYGYGKVIFNSLHVQAKDILKNHYNEVEFNEVLLSNGWTGLDELINTYNAYMTRKCHRYEIKFNKVNSVFEL